MAEDIALSSKQRVFAKAEPTKGTLVFPSGATDFIRPAGMAIINQTPSFTDSEELTASLDVMDRFRDSMPPATWRLSMYVRPVALGSNPQGHVLFRSLLGNPPTVTTARLRGAITAGSTRATYGSPVPISFPTKGVVQLGTGAGAEYFYYSGITRNSNGTQGTFLNMTRAYGGTSAIAGTDATLLTMKSVWYKQATQATTFSLWAETDHFVQGLSGCTADSATLRVTKTGGLKIDFTGQGKQMVWAGTSSLATNQVVRNTRATLYVANAKLFSAGSYIYNPNPTSGIGGSGVAADHNTGSGYKVLTSNATLNRLTISPAKTAHWATGDTVRGYLPSETSLGTAIEAQEATAMLASTTLKMKGADLNINCTKQFITDEIGVTYPEDFIPIKRDLTSTANIYFRPVDAKYFRDGYDSTTYGVTYTFGDTEGKKMLIHMPRASFDVPTIAGNPPAVELSMPMKFLGTSGEDSLELSFI